MRAITRLFPVAFFVGLALTFVPVLTGCGSGNHRGSGLKSPVIRGKGRARITVKWPEPDATRLIPVASRSIKVTVKEGATTIAEQIIARPNNTASFDTLPITTLTLFATAYPETSGSGTPQATGTVNFTVQSEGVTEVQLTMASTIERLEGAPASVSIGVAETTPLIATAYDSENRVVLTGPLQFTSAARKTATVNDDGVVTGQQVGATIITVTDPESGKAAPVPVTVTRTADYVLTWLALPPPFDLIWATVTGINDKGECVGYSAPDGEDVPNLPWVWKPNADDVGGQFTEMGLFAGYTQVYPMGINTAGQVCGDVRRNNGTESRAFLWENGQYTLLPTLGGNGASAYGINESGVVVGSAADASGSWRPCVWKNGQCIEALVGGQHQEGFLFDINDQESAVGYVSPDKPIRWQNGTGSFLPLHPNYAGAQSLSINNQDQIAGWLLDSTNPDAFREEGGIWTGGQVTGLGSLPDKTGGIATGINNLGIIVGHSSNNPEGFRWRNGVMENLNDLIPAIQREFPDTLQFTTAINNQGQIIGSGSYGPYLLTPQGANP